MNASIASSEQVSTQVNYLCIEIIYLFFLAIGQAYGKEVDRLKRGKPAWAWKLHPFVYADYQKSLSSAVNPILSWKFIYFSVLFLYLQKFWDILVKPSRVGP